RASPLLVAVASGLLDGRPRYRVGFARRHLRRHSRRTAVLGAPGPAPARTGGHHLTAGCGGRDPAPRTVRPLPGPALTFGLAGPVGHRRHRLVVTATPLGRHGARDPRLLARRRPAAPAAVAPQFSRRPGRRPRAELPPPERMAALLVDPPSAARRLRGIDWTC